MKRHHSVSDEERDTGVWEHILEHLNTEPERPWQIMCDRQSASAQCLSQKGRDNDQGIGKFQGGLTSKVHIVVDEQGRPLNCWYPSTVGMTSVRLQNSLMG